jgi:PAS domain S-box-containing protein
MTGKPTREELEQRVRELEKESERNQAKEALWKSEEKHRILFETMAQGAVYQNAEGDIIFANASAERILGMSIDQMRGKTSIDTQWKSIHEDGSAFPGETHPSMVALKTGKQVKDVIMGVFNPKEEAYRWIRINAVPQYKPGHSMPYQVYTTFRDITDLKRVEEALHFTQFAIDHSSDAAFWMESDARFIYVNLAATRALGYSKEELLEMTVHDIDPDFPPELWPDHWSEIKRRRSFIMESHHRTKAGRIFPVEITVNFLEFGGNEFNCAFVRDITERKQTENTLLESEIKFRSLFDSSPQAIALTSTETGKLIDVNNKCCELTKYAKEEIIGKTTTEVGFYTKEDRNRFIKHIQTSGEIQGLEMAVKAKDGSIFHTLMFAKVIRIAGNSFILTTFLDVTEQKRLKAELQQAHKMEAIGTLAGGIAHDFNNILGIILGNTELAIDDVPEWNPARYNLKEVISASLRAKDVIRQLLSFSRKTHLERKPVKVDAIITEALKLLQSSIPKNIELRLNIPKEAQTILADPTQINQILINLSTNAVHAMPDGGILEVNIKNTILDDDTAAQIPDLKPRPYVTLTVSDTGQGVNPKLKNRIFDPYFTTKEVGKGTGMGLSLVHGIVKSHEGAILVDSELGTGTTFSIFFPVVEEQAVIETETEEELPTGSERILLVDDEESIIYVGQNRLERLGYQVETRMNPLEALESFRTKPNQFDLIITDMTMPQMTGDQLVKEILKIRPDMPIILCTGFNENIDEEKAKEIGIRQYIEKPLKRGDLAKLVRQVLDEKGF